MVWSPADLLWSLTNRAQMTAFESVCANLFILLVLSPLITPIHNLIRGNQFNPEGKVLSALYSLLLYFFFFFCFLFLGGEGCCESIKKSGVAA